MGHSDSTSLRELFLNEESTHWPPPEVRVWGDMSYLAPASAGASVLCAGDELYERLGRLTRLLYEALRELGAHRHRSDSPGDLTAERGTFDGAEDPSAEAAGKVLDAVVRARCLQDEIAQYARRLQARVTSRKGKTDAARTDEARELCAALHEKTQRTNAILAEIHSAQDCHLRARERISKLVHLTQTLQAQMVQLLLDASANASHPQAGSSHTAARATPHGQDDGRADMARLDELLVNLGF
ncbi:MAG TPA: protein phosphatase CheZ [Burkholderiaceae bacterium]|nr:protein phosphatase CheZ [Burkholderiaceae bacterium]